MGWAERLPDGGWRACWRDESQRKRSTTKDPATGRPLTREAHAKRVAGEIEGRVRRGEDLALGRAPTWGDWLPLWLAERIVEPSTAKGDEYRIRVYLTPQWEGRKLNRISRTDVQTWANSLARGGISAGTVEKIVRLFSASMTAAVLNDRVPLLTNPCSGVKLPTPAPGKERYLTRPEVETIAYLLNQPYKLAVILAAWSGLRWGELAGLHWQRVDLETGIIHVVETWDDTAGKIKAYPKSKKPRRVPIAPRLRAALTEARDQTTNTRSCGQEHTAGGAKCRSGLVIVGDLGGPLNGKNFGRRQFRDAYTAAKIDPLTIHDLRHTYASWLVQAGVPLQQVQELLGHASITTTQRYAHLGTSQHAQVLAALS